MKNISLFLYLLLLIISTTLSSPLRAQDVRSIDIETTKDAYPRNNMYSSLDMYAELNGVFYFQADDGIHGVELWCTDGTANGTYLVKDINPGNASSNVNDIIVSGNHIYFSANDGVNGQELWTSDGTAAGTHLVLDINYLDQSSNPSYITDVNGTAFFLVNTFSVGNQLWKTDGTPEGTTLVADFTSLFPYGSNAKELTNVNGRLFFTMQSFYFDPQLYVTDGTFAGTHLVKEINPFGQDFPANLTALNGLLYFSATDETGSHLWVSDGTDSGTHAVKNAANISLPNEYYYGIDRPFTIKNKTLFFQGYNASNDFELYKYASDNAGANIKLVKDIVPGDASSYPANIANVNGTIFFTIGPAGADAQLWKSDGTTAGTVLVKDINPGGYNGYYGLINVNGKLMFAYANDALGFELWTSDGTDTGTVLVKDIFPGIYSSFPQFLTYKNGMFLFGAKNESKGLELYTSDGTTAGTVMIKDINHSSTSSSYPNFLTYIGNHKTVFNAATDKYGYELYTTNGTDRGTKLVKDIYPGSFGSYPHNITRVQNEAYFISYDPTSTYLGKSDGTASGTSSFYSLNGIYSTGYIQQTVATDNLFYFIVYNFTTSNQELWRSDGTSAGTYAVKTDLQPFFGLTPVGVGNTLFFINYDDTHGNELWKSDGTAGGTGLVKDINPGFVSSNPLSLTSFNGKLYFSADLGFGPNLWTSDGTEAGTKLVKPILLSYAQPFATTNTKLFFNAFNAYPQGYELYASDGTPAGIKLVKDINKGPANSFPSSLVNGNALLYFTADDGKHGIELWSSDGTQESTQLVKDITPGLASTYNISYMTNVNDKLFFIINDTLWQSDATSAGTYKVTDQTLSDASSLLNLTSAGDRLYFTAYKYSIGQELFTAKVSAASDEMITNITATPLLKSLDAFAVKLITNPVTASVNLVITSKDAQPIQVTISDVAGKTITSEKRTVSAGDNFISYKADNWAHGIYFIKAIAADGTVSMIKAVK